MLLTPWLSALRAGRKPARRFLKRRKGRRRLYSLVEPLEERVMLTTTPLHVFAQFPGEISTSGETDTFQISLTEENFSFARRTVILGFHTQAEEGSALSPAAVEILDAKGRPVRQTMPSADLADPGASLTVAELAPGTYSVVLAAEQGTTGGYTIDVFFSGDVDGDRSVTQADGDLLRSSLSTRSGQREYRIEADGNLDGEINELDNAYWAKNFQSGILGIDPLVVDLELAPPPVQLDGTLATNQANATLLGTTQPGALLELESNGDGDFGEDQTTADGSGDFSFAVVFQEGPNTFSVRASDSFGQERIASVSVVLDTQAPQVTIDTPADASATNGNVTVTGTAADNLTSVASVDVLIDCQLFFDATFDSTTGEFQFETAFPTDGSADGRHTLEVRATDGVGNVSPFVSTTFTLDTRPPVIEVASPEEGAVVDGNVTVSGTVADVLSEVSSLEARFDGAAFSGVAFDPITGAFAFDTDFATDGSDDGEHVLDLRATDGVGNVTSPVTVTFTLESAAAGVRLVEGANFAVVHQEAVVVPEEASTLQISYADLQFDTADGFMNDAFEAALVDADGRPLVHTIATSRDAFFNITEGGPEQASVNARHTPGLIEVDLTHIPAGTEATLLVRLVNNDADTTTSVGITGVEIVPGALGTPIGATFAAAAATAADEINFEDLSDVTASMAVEYGRTSFNDATTELFTDIALTNSGTYGVDGPLVVVVDGISEPGVHLRHFDDRTPDGRPFVRFDPSNSESTLGPGESTASRTLVFVNPAEVQFTFGLTVLAGLNRSSEITSRPVLEALVGKLYQYQVAADDSNDDALTFSLLAAPDGTTIDAETGLIEWTPAAQDEGSHTIILRADDGRGGAAEQSYTLTVLADVPNRPPVFTSQPPVDATVAAFFEVVDVPVGENPVGVAIGDFTGFGPNSIIAASQFDQTLSLVVGQGRETFADDIALGVGEPSGELTRTFIEGLAVDVGFNDPTNTSNSVFGVATADFNRDGILDLAANLFSNNGTAPDQGELAILISNGDGTFQPPRKIPLPNEPVVRGGHTMLTRDFDNDGLLDIVISVPAVNQVQFFKGDGTGDFARIPIASDAGGEARIVQTADLDGDGILDLVVNDEVPANSSIAMLKGVGDGSFAPPEFYTVDTFAHDIVIIDVDGANGPDLVINNSFRNIDGAVETIEVRLNDGTGTFGPGILTPFGGTGARRNAIHVADFDGDGAPDVVAANRLYISFHRGLGTGEFDAEQVILDEPVVQHSHNFTGKVPTDLNGDGLPDLIFGNGDISDFAQHTRITVGLNLGGGSFDFQSYVVNPSSSLGATSGRISVGVVVPGDFNHDGVIDLAVAQQATNIPGGLQVLLGDTPGSFLAPVIYPNDGGGSVAFADFNNDGIVDLAQGKDGLFAPILGVRFGMGDGKFGPRIDTVFATNFSPEFLAAADFDEDGKVDLALADDQASKIFYAFGLGDGTFTVPEQVPTSSVLRSFITADFNGDGHPDLAARVGFEPTSLEVSLFDPSTRTFNVVPDSGNLLSLSPTPGGNPGSRAVAAGDFDGDGIADLVAHAGAAGGEPERILFLKGKGAANPSDASDLFEAPVASNPEADFLGYIIAADFDGDGHLDLAGTGPGSGGIGGPDLTAIIPGHGDGTFGQAVAYPVGNTSFASIGAADLGSDGILDLIVGHSGLQAANEGRSFGTLVGRGDGTFFEPEFFAKSGAGVWYVDSADLDGDGRPDVVASGNNDNVTTLKASVVYLSSKPGLTAVETGDFNGDGRLDLLAANQANEHVKLLLGGGNNTFTRQHDVLVGRGPAALVTGDLNGNGVLDAVTANEYDDSITLLIGAGDGTFTRTDLAAGDRPSDVALGDLTGDGLSDIVVANAGGQSATLYVNQGGGTFAMGGEFPLGDVPHRIAIGDVTGDGVNDVVLTNPGSDRVTILPGLGNGTFDSALFVGAGEQPTGLAIGDLNQDGRNEIIVTNPGDDALGVLYNRGGGRFSRPQQIRVGAGPTDVRLRDVDRDGRLDLVTANFEGHTVSVVYNRFDEDQLYTYEATATDPDGDALTFTLVDGPGGMILDEQTGEIAWAPTADQAGPNTVTLEVSDGRGGTATQSFVIHVSGRADNTPPLITAEPETNVGVTQLYEDQLRAVDGDGDQLHYTLVSGPDGITVGDLDGRITWDPRSSGLEFDGANDFVAIPDSPSLRPDSFTIETWVRFDAIGDYTLLSKAVGSTHSFRLEFNDSGQLQGRVGGVSSGFIVSTPFDPEVGRWYHVAFSYEAVNGTQDLQLFIDGVLQTSQTKTAAILTYDASPILIGQSAGGGFRNFTGALDEVSIWSHVRSEAELAAARHRILDGNDPGLAAYYRFDEPDFLVVRDSSPNGNDGTRGDGRDTNVAPRRAPGVALVGSHDVILRVDDRQGGLVEHNFTIDIAPQMGGDIAGTVFNADISDNALQFDGNQLDFVEVPDSPSLHSDRGLTVSGWFKAGESTGLLQTIFFKGDSSGTGNSNRQYALFLHLDGYLQFSSTPVSRIGVGELLITTPVFVERDRWYHFAAVVDSDAEMMRLYVDGELLAHGAYDASGIRETTGPLRFGRDSTFVRAFTGDLDELRIYNVARTQAEIQTDMLTSAAGNESGLAAAWNFNETTGTTVFDLTANANDGTLGGDGVGTDLPERVVSSAPSSAQVLRDWVVFIDADRNGIRGPGEPSAVSDAEGRYVLSNLLPGDYNLVLEGRQGWLPVSPADGHTTATVIADQTLSVDFTNTQVGAPTDPRSPQITSAAPTTIEARQLLRYAAVVANPDGRPVTFDLPVAPDGMAVDPDTGVLVWRPTDSQVGEHRVLLRLRDDRGLVDIEDVTIEVAPGNTAPIITSQPLGPAVANRPFRYQVQAQDAEDMLLAFSLDVAPAGMTIDADTGRIDWTPTAGQLGPHDVTVLVADGRGGEAQQTFSLVVVADAPNADPVISSTPRTEVRLGNHYLYQVLATDPNPDPLTYELLAAPAGMTIDESGLLSWTPAPDQFGPNDVQLRVSDGQSGEAVQNFTIEVKSQAANEPPEFLSTPPEFAVVDQVFAYLADVLDADGDPVEFLLDEGPHGMSLDPRLGTLRWQPDAGQVGAHEVVLRAMDPSGVETAKRFTINTRGATANVPPAVVSIPPTEAAIGQTYIYHVDADDPDGDALTFALLAAPDGMTIDAHTGDVVWTPDADQLGIHSVLIRISDDRGAFTGQAFDIVVAAGLRNAAPVISSRPPATASIGEAYAYTIEVSDPEGEALSFELRRGPAGMSVDSTTGEVTYTPAAGEEGLVAVTFTAFDPAGAAAVQSFELLVLPANNAPVINSTAQVTIAAGALYRYDVAATDPDAEPLAFTLLTAPAGAAIDNFGRLRWQTETADLGLHDFEIQVTDLRGATAVQSFQLDVQPDTRAPLVSVVPHRHLIDVGQDLHVRVTATDNVGVESLTLFFDGTPVPLDEQGRAVIPNSPPGGGSFFNFHVLTATATDAAANVGQGSVTVNFRNQSQPQSTSNAPILEIITPAENGIVTAPSDVIGTVDDDNLSTYRLLVRRADQSDDHFVEFATGTTTVTDGVLGRFDPTLLENDSYVIRLEATDATGSTVFIDQTIGVAGELKLGNFRLSFVDLSISVSGIPITVARTYDTLRADREGDFGFGWRLEFRNADLRTSLPKTGLEDIGIHAAFKPGTRVYLTLPGGRREGFTFTPNIQVLPGFGDNLVVATPRFTPDPGVFNRLSVQSATLIVNEFGELYSGSGQPYNPAAEEFGGGYTLTTREGIIYRLDGNIGELLHVADRNGNRLTFSEAGVHSSTGKEVSFERDARGRITGVVDALGNRITYAYDAAGDLVSVIDRENNQTRFVYDAARPHFLDEVIDPLGRTGARSEYDADGRLIRVFNAAGSQIEFSHDPENLIETVTDALGNPIVFEVDGRGNVVIEIDQEGAVTRRTYDANNNLLTETDPLSRTTIFTYDGAGNVLTRTDPRSDTTRFTYNRFGQTTSETDPIGRTISATYDTAGNLISFDDGATISASSYDGAGNLTTRTEAGVTVVQNSYDSFGNVTSRVDAEGNETTFTYGANGNLLTTNSSQTTPGGPRTLTTTRTYDNEDRLISETDADGGTTGFEYDELGSRTAVIDALSRRTEFLFDERGLLLETIFPDETPIDDSDNPRITKEYDAAGRLVKETDEAGRATLFHYDTVGRLLETVFPDDTPNDDTDNPRTRNEYDLAGQLTAEIDELGNRTEFEYDAAGNLTVVRDSLLHELRVTYDAAGQGVAITDQLGRTTRFTYDDARRLVQIAFVDGSTVTNTYDDRGRLESLTDQAGNTTRYEYDNLSRLTAVIDALANRTAYQYDEQGNRIAQTDANGHTTTFEYDGLGRMIATARPLGQRSTTTYNAVGNVLSTTDFNGDTITFDYDARDRLIARNFPDGSSVGFTYTPTGRRETIVDSRGVTLFEYDERDRLLSRTDPDGRTISYTYDDAGNRTSATTPAGTVNYTFDALNRLATVIDAEGGATDYTYDAAGNLIRTDLPNGTTDTRQYDDLGRLVFLESVGPGGGLIHSFEYTLDAVGNRLVVREHDGRRVEYTYDEVYRLNRESIADPGGGSRTIAYTYDPVGNRLTRNDTAEGLSSYEYDANDRLVQEALNGLVTEYTYDANGNTLTKAVNGVLTVRYTWDFENRLIRVDSDGDGTDDVENRYDADGIRVAQIVNGTETRFLVDKNRQFAQVIEEYSPGGVIQVSYVHGNDLISQNRSGTKSFFHVDGLGSTRALTNAAGIVSDRYVYDAFGRLIDQVGSTENLFLFASEQRDFNIGLDYLRARYLDPSTGRFVSVDPFEGIVANPVSLHRYLYANANPTTFIDPSGQFTLVERVVVGGIIGTLAGGLFGAGVAVVDVTLGPNSAYFTFRQKMDIIVEEAAIGAIIGGLLGAVVGVAWPYLTATTTGATTTAATTGSLSAETLALTSEFFAFQVASGTGSVPLAVFYNPVLVRHIIELLKNYA